MRDDDHGNSRHGQDQCADHPPVGMRIAAQSTLQSLDRRAQSGQRAGKGDKAGQHSASAASRHINGHGSHGEKEGRYDGRKYNVMFDEVHGLC